MMRVESAFIIHLLGMPFFNVSPSVAKIHRFKVTELEGFVG